jgi:MFS family permease
MSIQPILRSLWPPLTSLVLLILASGLFNTFVSIRLEMEGFSPDSIGQITATLYAGVLVASFRIDRFIVKVGHIRAFILFAFTMGLTVLAQSAWINPWFWGALRFLGGFAMGGIYIVIESWFLLLSTPTTRGLVLSLYLAVLYGALSLGQFLINIFDPAGPFPFFLTALLCLLSILPLRGQKAAEPKMGPSSSLSLLSLFRLSPLGFAGGIISGMLLAAVYGLVPVYGKEIGLSVGEISTWMALIIFGGLSLQWPIGRWADKGDRRTVLVLASLGSALFSSALCWTPIEYLPLVGWLFGGFSFTLYPLSMGYTCQNAKEHQLVAVTGGFVLSYGIGAISGPLLAPLAMDWFGVEGLFYFLSLISVTLGLAGLFKPAREAAED